MAAPESIFRLDGKLALVTGASSGLGQHFVSVLAAAGARVHVWECVCVWVACVRVCVREGGRRRAAATLS